MGFKLSPAVTTPISWLVSSYHRAAVIGKSNSNLDFIEKNVAASVGTQPGNSSLACSKFMAAALYRRTFRLETDRANASPKNTQKEKK